MDRQYKTITQPSGYSIPITAVVNENWRGKNDPAERRRIQNRLNQRAFRERQRAGQSPKQYKARSMSGSQPDSSSEEEDDDEDCEDDDEDDEDEDDDDDDGEDDDDDVKSKGSLSSTEGNPWDELARLINRNLMQAAQANAQLLDIDLQTLQSGALTYTPRPTNRALPTALVPVELQYRVAHDPVFDIIPHPRLRHNILCAIANNQISAAALSRCIRGSGAIEQASGAGQRSGLVVWSAGDKLESWELSEQFFRQWTILLQGCEDLIAATNAWRSKRGERLFPSILERGGQKRS